MRIPPSTVREQTHLSAHKQGASWSKVTCRDMGAPALRLCSKPSPALRQVHTLPVCPLLSLDIQTRTFTKTFALQSTLFDSVYPCTDFKGVWWDVAHLQCRMDGCLLGGHCVPMWRTWGDRRGPHSSTARWHPVLSRCPKPLGAAPQQLHRMSHGAWAELNCTHKTVCMRKAMG